MISYELLKDENILIIEPLGPLSEEDFTRLAGDVDLHLAKNGKLDGVLINTKTFPGWDDLGAMVQHLRFVRDHHRKIRRLALVSDGKFAEFVPNIAKHFVAAEIKAFDFDQREAALEWLRTGSVPETDQSN